MNSLMHHSVQKKYKLPSINPKRTKHQEKTSSLLNSTKIVHLSFYQHSYVNSIEFLKRQMSQLALRRLSFSLCIKRATSVKLFSSVIFNRLTQWVNGKKFLHECQAGFRQNYSIVDQIFSLYNIAQIYKRRHKKLYTFFVDFRAAFNFIAREARFYNLYKVGISTKIINVLRAMYKNTKHVSGTESTYLKNLEQQWVLSRDAS